MWSNEELKTLQHAVVHTIWQYEEGLIIEDPPIILERLKNILEKIAESKVLPCPFCGLDDAVFVPQEMDNRMHAVYCDRCGASGPREYTVRDRVRRWNNRPPSISTVEVEKLLQEAQRENEAA